MSSVSGVPKGSGGRAHDVPYRRLLRTLRENPLALMGTLLVLLVLVCAIFAPWLAPKDPNAIDFGLRLRPPAGAHLFGTDDMGRDILSRCIFGFRISLTAAAGVLLAATAIGVFFGGTAGFFGGWSETVLMRLTDMFIAFPGHILALAIAGALGPSLNNAIIAVAFVWWPRYARMVRGQVLSVKHNVYVEAARALGAGNLRIFISHILRNCFSPVLVMATMDVGIVVIVLATLSFLGLGAQPPTPELGRMIARGRLYFLNQWWVATMPAGCVFVMALGMNLLGDSLRDILDPRSSKGSALKSK